MPPEVSQSRIDKVVLRSLTADDRPQIRRWMQQPEVTRYTVVVPDPSCVRERGYSTRDADRYLQILLGEPRRKTYAIVADGVHVGNLGLKDIDAHAQVAECFIEIGELCYRRRGIAHRAMLELLRICSSDSDIVELRLGVIEFNEAAIALYRNLGFSQAGLYGVHYADGRYWDIVEMRYCLSSESATRASSTVQTASMHQIVTR